MPFLKVDMVKPKKFVYKASLRNVDQAVSLDEKIDAIEDVIEKKLEHHSQEKKIADLQHQVLESSEMICALKDDIINKEAKME